MTNTIKDVFLRFAIPFLKLRGQCYDMAAAMAGKKSGVATQILKLEPWALYTHCYGHAVNLESLRREVIFKRIKSLKHLKKSSPGIRVVCPTRWTVKAHCVVS